MTSTDTCIHTAPTSLLASLIRCKLCDGTLVKLSCKRSECYGCYNAQKKACENKLALARRQLKNLHIDVLKEKFLEVRLRKKRPYYVLHTSIQTLAFVAS